MNTITVVPEHNELGRLQSMRKAAYTPAEVLAELIDNSNSARRKGQDMVKVDINIHYDQETKQYILSMQDNASGIRDTDLGKVLGQANSIGGGANNEHGMGLKQAAFTGQTFLRSIETKTIEAPVARKASFEKAEDILQPFEVFDSANLKTAGTKLEIVLPPEHPLLNKTEYYEALSELQLIYQKTLDAILRVTAKNDVLGLPVLNLQPDSAKQQLYNPVVQDNSWVIEKEFKKVGDLPWAATVRIGYIDENSFKPNLAAAGPNQTVLPTDKTRHGRGIEKQGIFIFKGDRMIQKTANWSLESSQNILDGRLNVLHNALNGLVMEIHLDSNFPTTPTKNRLKDDKALIEFRNELIGFLRDVQPRVRKGEDLPQGMPLYNYILQWNNVEKVKFDPVASLSWHHKQVKFQKNWKSMGKFGAWALWRHEDKVVAVHKNGFDAPVARDEVPDMLMLSEHIEEKTKGVVKLPIFVHNDHTQLHFIHCMDDFKPVVVTESQATKEIAHGSTGGPSKDRALRNASMIIMGMRNAMLKLPVSMQKTVLSLVSKNVGVDMEP